jgi:hypothetical protein
MAGGDNLTLSQYRYAVYGVTLHSEIQLSLPAATEREEVEIALTTASEAFFAAAIQGVPLESSDDSWYQRARTRDGSIYAKWEGVGEFLVSPDGDRITCREAAPNRAESFQVYLLGQALSFALVLRGFEPLHATVVAIDGAAAAFLGESGLGKSTLAACFLRAGYQLITDDLLILRQSPHGLLACVGPARIKLFPGVAQQYFPGAALGVPMNLDTSKLVLPLERGFMCSEELPIRAIYTIAAARVAADTRDVVDIEFLPAQAAFVELLAHTFNYRIVDRERLARQFRETARIVAAVPVKSLAYRRDFDATDAVVEAVVADMAALAASNARVDELSGS